MRRFIVILNIFVFSVFYYTGCSLVDYLVIYNNTNQTVIIHVYNMKDSLHEQAEMNSFTIPEQKAIKIMNPWCKGTRFKINIGHDIYIYNYGNAPWPHEYIESGNLTGPYVYLQLEQDGHIYLLKPNDFPKSEIDESEKGHSYPSTFPSAKIPEQPKGYPLVPVEKYKIISN